MPSVAVYLFRPGRSLAMTACAMLLYATLAITSLPANALTFSLDVELDTGLTGDFATVEITENAGALDFTITLNTDLLGPDADLNELYFTIVLSNVTILSVRIATQDRRMVEEVKVDYEIMQLRSLTGGTEYEFGK